MTPDAPDPQQTTKRDREPDCQRPLCTASGLCARQLPACHTDMLQLAYDTLTQECAALREQVKGWRCFHCGEVFTTIGAAGDHFGRAEGTMAGCLIDRVALEEGGKPERGRGLLMALRKAEAKLAAKEADCAALQQALRRIADWSDCACDHGEDCCAKLNDTQYHCPGCIAEAALSSSTPQQKA